MTRQEITEEDCEGCTHNRYESDTNAYVCTSKGGCNKTDSHGYDTYDGCE